MLLSYSIWRKDDVEIKEFILPSLQCIMSNNLLLRTIVDINGIKQIQLMYNSSLQLAITVESVKIIAYCSNDIISEEKNEKRK